MGDRFRWHQRDGRARQSRQCDANSLGWIPQPIFDDSHVRAADNCIRATRVRWSCHFRRRLRDAAGLERPGTNRRGSHRRMLCARDSRRYGVGSELTISPRPMKIFARPNRRCGDGRSDGMIAQADASSSVLRRTACEGPRLRIGAQPGNLPGAGRLARWHARYSEPVDRVRIPVVLITSPGGASSSADNHDHRQLSASCCR